jgi:hypothetical protein
LSKNKFTNLIGAIRDQQAQPQEPNTPESEQRFEPPVTEAPGLNETKPVKSQPKKPRYLTFVKKHVGLTEAQRQGLTASARRMSHAKKGGERITDDTLIRVAVTVLLEFGNKLEGKSEKEILANYRHLLKL